MLHTTYNKYCISLEENVVTALNKNITEEGKGEDTTTTVVLTPENTIWVQSLPPQFKTITKNDQIITTNEVRWTQQSKDQLIYDVDIFRANIVGNKIANKRICNSNGASIKKVSFDDKGRLRIPYMKYDLNRGGYTSYTGHKRFLENYKKSFQYPKDSKERQKIIGNLPRYTIYIVDNNILIFDTYGLAMYLNNNSSDFDKIQVVNKDGGYSNGNKEACIHYYLVPIIPLMSHECFIKRLPLY